MEQTPPPPDIEGTLMEHVEKYPNCQCTQSWVQIRESGSRTLTGVLGKFMVIDKYKVWVFL